MNVLEVIDVSAGYGENDIISNINLTVAEGEIVTIAGTNGAGKSTLTKAVVGLAPRVSGRILVKNEDITGVRAEKRSRFGLSYVPQVRNVFGRLSVRENLLIVEGVADKQKKIEKTFEMFPVLGEKRKLAANLLSGGEKQMLAFAMALLTNPSVMVLDEPTAALAPALVRYVLDIISSVANERIGVLLVEQRAREALAISSRGYILDRGKIVLDGDAQALLDNQEMAELYLGAKGNH